MTAATAERTWSTRAATEFLGISYRQMYLWLGLLGLTGTGSGYGIRIDATTMATLAAWKVMAAEGLPPGSGRRRVAAVAAALIDGPAPYVVVLDDDHATAFDDGPAAVRAAAEAPGPGVRQLVDVSYLWDDLL